MNPRLIPARELTVGPATVIFRLPGRTLRSRVELVVHEPGIVRVAFASGDILSLSERAMVGVLPSRPPAPRRSRATR